ncbi:hypothetical protein AMATHDRAFT_65917, partial [Amanita thiersii Skay4041]
MAANALNVKFTILSFTPFSSHLIRPRFIYLVFATQAFILRWSTLPNYISLLDPHEECVVNWRYFD